jgi:hypothetical protein
MMEITNICEPTRLFVTWQPKDGGTRFVIGEINKNDTDSFELALYVDSPEFTSAKDRGFAGLPFFDKNTAQTSNNVIENFSRRLPPAKRGDFELYLKSFLLPFPYTGSLFSLLGHTGAKLPGDSLALIPDFSTAERPFDYLLEVAGTRHQEGINIEKINVGDSVELMKEPQNNHDKNAIAIMHDGLRIGYINKACCDFFNKLDVSKIESHIAKKNGTASRPLIYIMISVN